MPNHESDTIADRLLLSRLKNGDSVAFNELYEKYWKSIYVNSYKRLQDRDHAKDITQDVFLELWNKRKEIDTQNPVAYLRAAARNKVFNKMERERKYTPIPDLLLSISANTDAADADLLYKEFLLSYEALIDSLTGAQQKIFRMRFQQGLSTAQIAQVLSISRKTVQNQLGKAVTHLRSALGLMVLLVLLGIKQ